MVSLTHPCIAEQVPRQGIAPFQTGHLAAPQSKSPASLPQSPQGQEEGPGAVCRVRSFSKSATCCCCCCCCWFVCGSTTFHFGEYRTRHHKIKSKPGNSNFQSTPIFFPHTERSFLHLLICPAYLTLAQRQKEGEMETARVTQNEPWNKPREKLRQSKRAGINHSKRKQQRSSHKTRRGALRPLNGSASTPTKDEAQLAKNTVASDAPSVNTIAKNNSGSQNNGRSKPAGDNKHAEDTASQTTTSYFHQVRYTSPCLFSKQTNSQPSTFAPCCTLLHIHPSLFKVVTQAHLPPPTCCIVGSHAKSQCTAEASEPLAREASHLPCNVLSPSDSETIDNEFRSPNISVDSIDGSFTESPPGSLNDSALLSDSRLASILHQHSTPPAYTVIAETHSSLRTVLQSCRSLVREMREVLSNATRKPIFTELRISGRSCSVPAVLQYQRP